MTTPTRTLVEALLIGASGFGLGLLGNALSPAGLRIDRDYFPAAANPPAPAPPTTPAPAPAPTAAAPAAAGAVAPASEIEAKARERLAAHGLTAIGFEEARTLYEDPMYAAGGLLFVDARNDEEYEEGHIPLALQFDHYHAERYLDAVLQAAPGTSRIVVYCNGGNCEDSEFAAATLKDFLAEPERLCVYVGGVEEWRAHGMPIETGKP
jgi:rhodanese-related sulfurtransferase